MKDLPPDHHPHASRITPALLQTDMCISTALLQIHIAHMNSLTDHSITLLRTLIAHLKKM